LQPHQLMMMLNFTISYTFYAPESGLFYFNLADSDSSVNSTTVLLTTAINVCGGSLIGSSCNFTVVPITNFSLEYSAKFSSANDNLLNDNWRYYSFELPEFPANQNLQVTVTILNTTDDDRAYVVYTKNNFPYITDGGRADGQNNFIENDDQPTNHFLYTPYDKLSTNAVITNYIGIACDFGYCNTTLSFQWVNSVSTTSTSSGTSLSTTTSSATSTTTTTTTSGNPTTTATGTTTTTTTSGTTTTTTTTSTSTSTNLTTHALTTHNLTTSVSTTTTTGLTTGLIHTTSSASALVVSLLAILAVLF